MKKSLKWIVLMASAIILLILCFSLLNNSKETTDVKKTVEHTEKNENPYKIKDENHKEKNEISKTKEKLRENDIFIPFSLPKDQKGYEYVAEDVERRAQENFKEMEKVTGSNITIVKSEWNKELNAQDVYFTSSDLNSPVYSFAWDEEIYEEEGRENTPFEIRYLSAKLTEELPKGFEVNVTSNLPFKEIYQFLFKEPEGWTDLKGEKGSIDISVIAHDSESVRNETFSEIHEWIKSHQFSQDDIHIYLITEKSNDKVWNKQTQKFE